MGVFRAFSGKRTSILGLMAGILLTLLVAARLPLGRTSSQSGTQPGSFEVVLVKPSADNEGRSMQIAPTGLRMQRATLRALIRIRYAYGVQDYAIAGPAWIDTEAYTVVAKPFAGTPINVLPTILQALLSERFDCNCTASHAWFAG
jgi:hypothetical protein